MSIQARPELDKSGDNGDQTTVIGFPLSEEEQAQRVMREAQRLANLAPGEWKIWSSKSAERLGIPLAVLEDLVRAQLKEKEKREREAKGEERRIEQRAERQQAAAEREQKRDHERDQRRIKKEAERKNKLKLQEFVAIQKLPTADREAKLAELAKRLDESVESIHEEFAEFVGVDADPGLEPWPEPIETEALLLELMAQLRRYVDIHDEGAIAFVLWVTMAWLHNEIATHSPILVMTSADEDSGKSTSLGVLERLTPCPYSSVELTGPNVYHIVDRLQPTLIVDEADKLFHRKPDLMHIVNHSWIRGAKIPRLVRGAWHDFNVFCPKVLGMKGLDLPSTTASRCIVVKLWPKLLEKKIEDFAFVDDDTFVALRRKLLRWKTDNAAALNGATPVMPPGFNNRLRVNWKLLLAVAELASHDFAKRTRAAALKLSRKRHQPSEGRRLLEASEPIVAGEKFIASAELRARLNVDPTAEWCDFRNKGPISEKQIANLLAPYDIFPQVYHPTKRSTDSQRGYLVAQFERAFAHFLPRNRTSVHR